MSLVAVYPVLRRSICGWHQLAQANDRLWQWRVGLRQTPNRRARSVKKRPKLAEPRRQRCQILIVSRNQHQRDVCTFSRRGSVSVFTVPFGQPCSKSYVRFFFLPEPRARVRPRVTTVDPSFQSSGWVAFFVPMTASNDPNLALTRTCRPWGADAATAVRGFRRLLACSTWTVQWRSGGVFGQAA